MLRVEHPDLVYWETCGNPDGAAAVVLHGGPGSGCTAWHRRFFDPSAYRIVLFDQRGCGRSTPHAADTPVNLSRNTTRHLIGDLELLREHLGVERWLVWGGSWGSTLALAYAEAHPQRVSAIVLWGVTTGRRSELDWTFRGGLAGRLPDAWGRFRDGSPGEDVVAGYHGLLTDPDPSVHHAAAREWCLWESATVGHDGLAPRFRDPSYALAFARIVTHYVLHDLWLGDDELLRGADVLADVPGVMVAARNDLQAPVDNARALQSCWPAKLVVVDGGHSPAEVAVARELVAATDAFRA